MMSEAPTPTHSSNPDLPENSDPSSRMRSVPWRLPFLMAEIYGLIHLCAAISVLTALVHLLRNPSPFLVKILIGSLLFFIVSGIASFLQRRTVLCPLCKGTPFISTPIHVHPKAKRIFPLTHAATALIWLIFTQTFRCMHCASKFDILKYRPGNRSRNAGHQQS